MNYNFASRIGGLKPSAIREILKVTQDPSVISFAAGNPAPEAFPVKEMKQIADELFDERAAYALQYGASEGYAPLRELTAARLKEKYNIGTKLLMKWRTGQSQSSTQGSSRPLVN